MRLANDVWLSARLAGGDSEIQSQYRTRTKSSVSRSVSASDSTRRVQMVVTASQMATSQFHSVPDRRATAAQRHRSLSAAGGQAGLGGPAGNVIGLNANQRRAAPRRTSASWVHLPTCRCHANRITVGYRWKDCSSSSNCLTGVKSMIYIMSPWQRRLRTSNPTSAPAQCILYERHKRNTKQAPK